MRTTVFAVVLSMVLLSAVALAEDSARLAERTPVSTLAQANNPLARGAKADVPGMINYQGTLTDDGVALDTTVSMTFSIYTDSTGGTQLWTETQPAVEVSSGLFHVLLGRVNAISDTIFSDPERWLGIQVGLDPEMTPRQRIAAVGFAFWAAEADTAEYARSAAAASDGDWTISGNVLYPVVDYGLSMRSSNIMHGQHDSTHVNLGISSTTGTAGQDWKYCTVGGGAYNTASGWEATVGGGNYNTASEYRATVGGGYGNTASFTLATVGGGSGNTASNYCATVGGGINNSSGYGASVGGGFTNSANGAFATVGGGFRDTVYAYEGGVAAGSFNLAGDADTDTAAFIGGGSHNSATANYATVGGGWSNAASGNYATVGGGENNSATTRATVGGGQDNTASFYNATVGGGYNNTASLSGATVGGGASNTASGSDATVGGGRENSASEPYATVGGGYLNISDADYSFTACYNSNVPSWYDHSAAFNGQTATASSQTRVGALSKASGTFTIDHPIDPQNKILNHYFIESPEMINVYRGVAHLDSDGRAEVKLPDYFDELNRNPMVQLTGVGTSDIYVSEDVEGNRFAIGGAPGTKVYWAVTGDRKDPSAEITRILMPVEQLKEGDLAGHSLDDDFLATTMSQLERMGQAGKFSFRTPAGREKYERALQALENAGLMEPGVRD
jgi:hypothetical protein